MDIAANLQRIRKEVEAGGARLIAVSKTQPVDRIREAYDAGQRLFGENKVQEMIAKHPALPADIEWHMIGHLQTNKVKQVVPVAKLIHSVDSFRVLEEINKQGQKINARVSCLLQVHIAQEETKFGFDRKELDELIGGNALSGLGFISIIGLMGMASLTDRQDKIRQEFKGLRNLFEELGRTRTSANVRMKELSMGMTSDYRIAIEEGSTLIRIGTAIFGERNKTAEA